MSRLLFLVIFVFAQAVSADEIPYQDDQFKCIEAATAERYVRDFNINVQSFGGFELCDSRIDTKKLFNDLEIIEKGVYKPTGSDHKLIKGFIPADRYYQWMKQETRGVERGHDIPYAIAYNSGGYFTMQDGWAQASTLGRVGTIIHEARHTAGYNHIRCQQGPYVGTGVFGCDTNYSYGGSHAVEMEYYARVATQGQNFHPVYKKMARLMAIARTNIFFNTPVIQKREAVLALAHNREAAHLYDNGIWYEREVPSVQGRMKRTSFGAVLFDGLKSFAIELYENSGFTDLVEDTYSYYKILIESKQAVRDLEEYDQGNKRFLLKVGTDNKLSAYEFARGEWGRAVSLNFDFERFSTSAVGQPAGLYMISKAGEIYNYDPFNKSIKKINSTWSPEHEEVIVYKGQNLVLLKTGQVLQETSAGLEAWPAARMPYSGLVTTPVYDGFEVVRQ